MVNHQYSFEKNFVPIEKAFMMMDHAIKNGENYSLGRFGIGELTLLMKDSILIKHFQKYRAYAGITASDEEIRKELINALKTTDLPGFIPSWRLEFWAKMTKNVLEELNLTPPRACCAWIMHDALKQGVFWPWIKDKAIVLVGRRSHQAVPMFLEKGVKVCGTVSLEGYHEIAKAHESLLKLKGWDIAVVSAGIPATILVPKIAKSASKVAIDFGHTLDMIIDGESYDHLQLVNEFNVSHLKGDS